MAELEHWDSFYVIVGAAAGALIGLQFVVMTLIAENPPKRVAEHPALQGKTLANTGGINLHANLLVTKTLLIAGEGWGGAPVVRAYDKKTGEVVGEVKIPGMMGSMPMTYMVGGKQYIAFTVGTPMEPASVVALAVE